MRALALLLLATATAAADPAHDQADVLFQQGRDQLAAGKLAEACESFARSDQAEPAATTLLALGVCREKIGQLATAWTLYQEVGKRLTGASDATSKQLAQVAASDAAKVAPRVSRLTIAVAADRQPPGLEVRRGDAIIPADAWNTATPLDGGTYSISVHAPGHDAWTTTITLAAERDVQTVEVPVLASIPVAAARPAPPAPQVAPEAHRAPSRALPIALGAGAVVLGAVALGLEISARHTYDDAKLEADDARQISLWHSANTRRHAAQAVGIGGLAAAGFAVWLFVRSDAGESRGVAIAPLVGADQLGIAIGGPY